MMDSFVILQTEHTTEHDQLVVWQHMHHHQRQLIKTNN